MENATKVYQLVLLNFAQYIENDNIIATRHDSSYFSIYYL